MNKIINWLEKRFVPFASRLGSQRHLVAIRDSFIAIMPITMAGSMAVLVNALVRDIPNGYDLEYIANAFEWLITINNFVWWGTLGILSAVLAFSIGYHFAQSYGVDPIAGGIVAFSSFIITLPQTAEFSVTINGITHEISKWGFLDLNYLNTGGLFTALIIGMSSALIFSRLVNENLVINLPEEVPSGIARAFVSILPGIITLYVIGALSWVVHAYFPESGGLPNLIHTFLQKPFISMSQNVFSIIVISFSVSLFWIFGLHGPNVLAPALEGIYGVALSENVNFYQLFQTKEGLPHLWTRGSFDAFSWMGGSGSTLGLILAIFMFSKRADSRAIAKYSLPMGIFNINEPVVFGLPIVLNPIYIIPFLLVPMIQVIIAYYITKAGWIPPVHIHVPWVIPPVLYAFFSTGFSFLAALVALLNIGISVMIWGAFVILADRMSYQTPKSKEAE